jgi:DNA polymerase-3 subunit delta'
MSGLPEMDRMRAMKLSDAAGARGAETRFDLTLATARPIAGAAGADRGNRAGARAHRSGRGCLLRRLAPDAAAGRAWAELAADLTARARRGKAVNLDPAALIFDMFLDLDRTAERLAVPAA